MKPLRVIWRLPLFIVRMAWLVFAVILSAPVLMVCAWLTHPSKLDKLGRDYKAAMNRVIF